MPSQSSPLHVVVVGGGIAGLAAARALVSARPDLAVTILEASPAVGGKLRLGEIAGRPVDLGAEALLNRRPEATDLAHAVGLGPSLVHPATSAAAIWSRGALRPMPPTVFGVPVGVGTAVRSGLLSRRGALRARMERRMAAQESGEDVAVGRLVARRLGGEVRDRLVEPVLGGIYAGRADELSFAATMPQLHREVAAGGGLLAAAARLRPQSADRAGEATPVFAGIAGGVGRLAVAVADDVVARGAAVRLSASVRQLERTSAGWRLVVGPTVAPEEMLADGVVLAVPAAPASRLLAGVAPSAAGELAAIEYASMALVTMAMRTADVSSSRLEGSGFLVPPVEGRAIKAATYSSRKWGWLAGDTVVVRCSVGRHREAGLLQRDDSELVGAAVTDLAAATGVRGPLIDAQVTRWGGALPQYAVGHLERVDRIRQAVAAVPGLELCGAAYDGIGVAAVIASAQQAATRLLDQLNRPRQ